MVSENKTGLASALLKAQSEFPEIPKDKENPHFRSRYSTFDAIKTACWPVLHKHGILPRHKTTQVDGTLTVTFTLTHAETGETDENSLSVAAGPNVQAIGSQITYLRRYTCAPALGICSDEDDDGNSGAAPPAKKAPAKAQQREQPPQKPAPPVKETATFDPPKDWPETDIHDLKIWVESFVAASQFEAALGMFLNEPSLVGVITDWENVLRHFAATYKAKYAQVGSPKFTAIVKAALDKMEQDKREMAAFDESEAAAT